MIDNIINNQIEYEMDKETKINLIRHAIRSENGWYKLAQPIKNSSDPIIARQKCVDLFRDIAGDQEIDVPVYSYIENREDRCLVSCKLLDRLCDQLDRFLQNNVELDK